MTAKPKSYGIYIPGKGYFATQGREQWHQPKIAGWAEFISHRDACQIARSHCFFECYEIHEKT